MGIVIHFANWVNSISATCAHKVDSMVTQGVGLTYAAAVTIMGISSILASVADVLPLHILL